MSKFISELKRRRVFRAAISYLIVAWLVVQVISTIGPALGLTEKFMRYTLLVLSVGFPIAMALSWFYAFSTHGVSKESVDIDEPVAARGRNLDFAVIGVLAIALVGALLYIGVTQDSPSGDKPTNVLAVLPLTNISSSTPDNGFVDGLHDDLLSTLSQLSPLHVISRTSVLGFRNTTVPLREIGSLLGADKIIEGSIQLANDMIRISIRLIDVETDSPLWDKTYNRPFNATELFSLQRNIALAVAKELKVALALNEDERLQSLPTASTEAYRLYLLGRLRTADRTSASLEEAVDLFERAIDIDPQYAEAYAALALAESLAYSYSNVPLEDMIRRAMPLVQRALELDGNLSDAYVVLADLRGLRDDGQGAKSAYHKALELNSNSALARHWYGTLLRNEGRYREALTQHLLAQKLDPLSPIISVNVAQDYTYLGDTDAALAEYQRTLEIKPDFVPVYAHMADLNGKSLRRPDEAVRWLRKAHTLDPGHTEYPSHLAENLLNLDDPDNAGLWANIAFKLGPKQYWPNRAMMLHALYTSNEALLQKHSAIVLDLAPSQLHSLMYVAQKLIDANDAAAAKQLFLPQFSSMLEQPPVVDSATYPWAVLLAHVLQANDDHAQATALLNASLEVMQNEPRIGYGGIELFDVAALALLGRSDDAISKLAEAKASLWSNGWWTIRHQPLFASIRERPEVVAFDKDMQQEMSKLRETLSGEGTPLVSAN